MFNIIKDIHVQQVCAQLNMNKENDRLLEREGKMAVTHHKRSGLKVTQELPLSIYM